MTAAHAHEYEVPEHAPAPVEAVEQAEGGQIVYLTRGGQRVAAVVPAGQTETDRQTVEAVVKVVSDLIALDPQRARDTIVGLLRTVPAPSTETQVAIREELIDFLDDIDSAPVLREKAARLRSGELETVPWDQVKRGLDL
jgi:antitoxin (DNA-binding transcriptional repressor) of toxin-antitoxin stability system